LSILLAYGLQVFLMSNCNDLIRCLSCKSIDPTLYTDRLVCCEPASLEVLDTHIQMSIDLFWTRFCETL